MRLVILDRDGVINQESDAYIKSPEEWIPIPGSLEALARLHRADFAVAVASNQAGVGRGLFDSNALDAIHRKMQMAIAQAGGKLDGIFVCPHAPWDECECRKPKPGLLRQIARHFHTDLHGVPVIGDSLRDIQAAQSVGASPWLVRSGYGEATLKKLGNRAEVKIVADLAAAADALLSEAHA